MADALKIQIQGLREFEKQVGAKVLGAIKGVEDAVEKATLLVHSSTVKLLSQRGTGRIYKRYRGKSKSKRRKGRANFITHQASVKGRPPAPDTGALRSSIKFNVKKRGLRTIGTVFTNQKYAKALEFGTRNGRIKRRPFLKPARDNNEMKTRKRVGGQVTNFDAIKILKAIA